MDSVESFIWLKRRKLFESCRRYAPRLKVVFAECLKPEDDVLIIGDKGFLGREIAPVYCGGCFLAARSLNFNVKLVLQNDDTEVCRALEQLRPGGVVVLGLSERLGRINNKSFRRFCQERRLRFASTPSLGALATNKINVLVDAINVDYKQELYVHGLVKRMLDYGEHVHITTKAGTNLHVGIKGCMAVSSAGVYLKEGEGGNLPGGEVFIAPAKKQVEGRVVVDASSRNRDTTVLVKKPIIIDIENGEVVRIEGKEADLLRKSIEDAERTGKPDWGVRRVGELGIGLNPKAKLSGSMIIDEKVSKTAHIAIGSNNWFGGGVWASIHLDQVFKNPKIKVDGREIKV
ncbi:MAG: aminopeptidase [Candidatus Woesearchaeota archaeon]